MHQSISTHYTLQMSLQPMIISLKQGLFHEKHSVRKHLREPNGHTQKVAESE